MKQERMPDGEVRRHLEAIRIREAIGPCSIVTLKSGGPAMTVSEVSTDKACCLWHEDDGELCTYWFPLHVLEPKK